MISFYQIKNTVYININILYTEYIFSVLCPRLLTVHEACYTGTIVAKIEKHGAKDEIFYVLEANLY